MTGANQKSFLKDRIYVCHTYYHVYVACLKELNARDGRGATLVLSRMSNDFGNLKERAEKSGIFEEVVEFDEKDYTYFPELVELKKDRGNLVRNMFQRMKFCKRLGELEAPFVPVDFREYQDIYVFCDSDPIGYYLSYQKIPYHAVEDGLDCIRYRDTARDDNRGAFPLKAWMARRGLIFIQNGYGRYCLDMEVNDLSVLDHPMGKMIENNREALVRGLTEEDRARLVSMFIENKAALDAVLERAKSRRLPVILILTEPLCQDLAVREQLFRDMIEEYGFVEENGEKKRGVIVIKPHPRDLLDYQKAFPEELVLDAHFPMEILNFIGAEFDRVVTVYTVPSSIHCAREKVYLGNDWMDRYEDPSMHRSVTNAAKKITA